MPRPSLTTSEVTTLEVIKRLRSANLRPAPIPVLVQQTGLNNSEVTSACRSLTERGVIRRVIGRGKGGWELVSDPAEESDDSSDPAANAA